MSLVSNLIFVFPCYVSKLIMTNILKYYECEIESMKGYGNGDWEEVQSGMQYCESRPLDVIILAGYEN